MSYQVLARKWRPKTFSELMGQEHVVSVLVNAITQQRLHHAYLFTGTRGVGKTTIARIFAKSLNCEEGVSAEPCGKCDTCLDIDQGRFVDLLEIDAASRTKVDDTREILDNVQYAPTRGRYKVYLIDEVHMLSRSSFNALLKTLEEPPEHVKFILATTDPQKLPVTVLSRCLQFHLKALSVTQIAQQLEKILDAEQVTFEPECLNVLAKAARGSMRDSLSLTDQAVAQGQGHISVANLQSMLGGIDQHWPYKILMSLLKRDSIQLMELSREIASYAPNYHRLYAELIQLLHHVAMYQIVEQHFDVSPEHAVLIKKFSQSMSAQDIQLYYQLALNGRKDLAYVGDEQAAFDMTLLRLLAFKPMEANEATTHQQSATANESTVDFDDIELPASSVQEAVTPISSEESALKPLNTVESTVQESDGRLAEPTTGSRHDSDTGFIDESEAPEALHQEMFAIEEQAFEQKATQQHAATYQPDVQKVANTEAPSTITESVTEESVTLSSEQDIDSSDDAETIEEPTQTLPEGGGTNEQLHASFESPAIQSQPALDTTSIDEPVNSDQQVVQSDTGTERPSLLAQIQSSKAESGNTVQPDDRDASEEESPETNNALPEGVLSSSVESVLATRNMLRSRKKKLEKDAKKSSGADAPALDPVAQAKQAQTIEVPDMETLPEQGFTIEDVNPAEVKKANQVDKWANMIDSMALNGRLRQLALRATIAPESNDQTLILNLNQATKHLKTDAAMEQLHQFVSDYFNQQMQVEVNIVDETVDDPFQIQGQINEKRYDYAKELLAQDTIVLALQQDFQATVDETTIVAL
ncbi:DNA polymerase III subunit gamma/tau [Thalassotalea euphylliae]|uniref:DNA polymerase III subunit gamma/tau n=1 Tax=Thalassotalea euphylliae TaxID=1655234 RepID=UPI00363687EF